MSEQSLESIISGDAEETAETVTEETTTPEVETAETETEVKTETEEPKPDSGAKEKTDKQEKEEKEERGTLAGLKAERAKRQALEGERDSLSARITQLEGQAPAKQSEPPKAIDPIEDPVGFARQIRRENEALNLKMVLRLSRSAMSRQVDDFDETMSVFTELAKVDRTIAEKMLIAEDPYHFAYEHAEKHIEFQDVENVEEWKSKTRAELKEEVKAELLAETSEEAKVEETNSEAVQIPSLASKTSVDGGINTSSVDVTLDDILGGSYTSKKK